jgi:hypothetical protein
LHGGELMSERFFMGRRRRVALAFGWVGVVLAAACGRSSLVGTPCTEAGEELCEDVAKLRCDGTVYALLAPCHHECVEGAGIEHTVDVAADETWTCADGPHVLTNRVTVAPGATLTIEAGAQLRIDPSFTLDVDEEGRLVADATAGAPILVTANNGQQAGFGTSSQGGVNVFAVPAGREPSVLRHVIIERAFNGLGVSGLSDVATPPVVENCTFRDNDRLGIKVRCDAADAADPDIVVPDFAAAGNQFFENGEGDVGQCAVP